MIWCFIIIVVYNPGYWRKHVQIKHKVCNIADWLGGNLFFAQRLATNTRVLSGESPPPISVYKSSWRALQQAAGPRTRLWHTVTGSEARFYKKTQPYSIDELKLLSSLSQWQPWSFFFFFCLKANLDFKSLWSLTSVFLKKILKCRIGLKHGKQIQDLFCNIRFSPE